MSMSQNHPLEGLVHRSRLEIKITCESATSCIAIAGMSIITIIHTELRPNQYGQANSAYIYCTGCEKGEDFQDGVAILNFTMANKMAGKS